MTHANGGSTDMAGADTIEKFYWVLNTDVTVPHSLATTWALFKDPRKWYTEYA